MYTEEFLAQAIVPQSSAGLTACSLTSTSTYMRYLVMDSIKLTRLMGYVATAVATSTANAVVTYYQRPTFGSTSGEVAIGTLTFPTGSATGKVIYKNVESVSLLAGQELVIKVTTAGTDASAAAGAAFLGFKAMLRPEDPASMSLMVASV